MSSGIDSTGWIIVGPVSFKIKFTSFNVQIVGIHYGHTVRVLQ